MIRVEDQGNHFFTVKGVRYLGRDNLIYHVPLFYFLYNDALFALSLTSLATFSVHLNFFKDPCRRITWLELPSSESEQQLPPILAI